MPSPSGAPWGHFQGTAGRQGQTPSALRLGVTLCGVTAQLPTLGSGCPGTVWFDHSRALRLNHCALGRGELLKTMNDSWMCNQSCLILSLYPFLYCSKYVS